MLYIPHHYVILWLGSLTINIIEVCVCCGTLLLSKILNTLILQRNWCLLHGRGSTEHSYEHIQNCLPLSSIINRLSLTDFFFHMILTYEKMFGAIQSPFHVPSIRVQNPGKCTQWYQNHVCNAFWDVILCRGKRGKGNRLSMMLGYIVLPA